MRKLIFPFSVMVLLVAAVLRLWQLHTYPPGPHYDEAVEILITRSIAFDGANFFPIVNSYQGREALFYYLSAPLFQFVHDGVFSLRVANVFCNLVTIAASMALGRFMFTGNRGLTVGLTIGVLITLSFPQIWLSRQAFRTGPLPMLQALSLLFLWRGLEARRRAWLLLILGGIFGGAALYTYMASRLFPLWLLLGVAMVWWLDQGNRLKKLQQGLIFMAALGITAVPMALYALQNPDIFFRRLSEVTTAGEIVSLPESIRRHLLMFFVQGEGYVRYNLPGRPYLTWPEGLLMLVGITVCIWRLMKAGKATERAAYWLALLSPLMVIPSVISVGGLPPNHMRSVGMVPLIFVLTAVGFEAIFTRISAVIRNYPSLSRYAVISQSSVVVLSVLSVLLIGGFLVGHVYFDWARRADVFYETDADLALAARWLPSQVDEDTVVYIGSRHVEHPTIIAGWNGEAIWLGQNALFLPPPGKTALVAYAHLDPPVSDWAAWLAPYQIQDVPVGPDNSPAFYAYRIPSGDHLLDRLQLVQPSIHNSLMTLVGVMTTPIAAGESGEIQMAWRIDQSLPFNDLRPIVQLEDTEGTLLSRTTSYIVFTDRWQPGAIVLLRTMVDVPIGTPPGDYRLLVTWGSASHDTYISYMDESGAQSGLWADIGRLPVTRPHSFPSPSALTIANRHKIDVAPGARLLGWNSPPTTIRPGETMALKLFWQGLCCDSDSDALTMQALLEDGNGEATVVYKGDLTVGHPSNSWLEGELITAPMYWTVPREQPSGQYRLAVVIGESRVELGTMEVTGLPRVFDAPSVEAVLDTRFGDSLSLYGYNLDTAGGISLELVWQSLAEVDTDYTVFVHLVAEDGTIVMQRDFMPQNNIYPTSLWVAGEYVRDDYHFVGVPPGRYRLRVGLYRQTDGQRLPVVSAEPVTDFIEIGPIEIRLES